MKGQRRQTYRRIRPGEIDSEAIRRGIEKYHKAVEDDYASGRMPPKGLTPEQRMIVLD